MQTTTRPYICTLSTTLIISGLIVITIRNTTSQIHGRICGDSTQATETCNEETAIRFGCCFPMDPTTKLQKWDHYEEISTPGALIPIEYCDPDKPVASQCGTITPTYNAMGHEVICAGLPEIVVPTSTMKYIGRCRSAKEKQVLKSKFHERKIHIRSHWANEQRNPKVRPCRFDAYERKKIEALWDRYLRCPFDHVYLDKEFNKLLEEAYFFPPLLEELCLVSHNMEVCISDGVAPASGGAESGKCQCLSKRFQIRRVDKHGKEELYDWNFEQITEGLHCAQAAKRPCTFNIKDLMTLNDTSSLIRNPTERSPLELYRGCDEKGYDLKDKVVLPDFTCEQDAVCESKLQPGGKCTATHDCKCLCARGYECHDEGHRVQGGDNRVILTSLCIVALFSQFILYT